MIRSATQLTGCKNFDWKKGISEQTVNYIDNYDTSNGKYKLFKTKYQQQLHYWKS